MDGSGRDGRDDEPGLSLFRAEVLRAQQASWLGTVLVKPRALHWWFAGLAALTTVLVVAVLCLGSYTKRARVPGWLVPAQGMVRVFAPRAAVATGIFVQEGSVVTQGQQLATLSTEELSMALGETQAHVVRALAAQRDSLAAEGERNRELLRQQRATMAERIAALRREEQNMQREIGLQKSRVTMARQWEARLRELQKLGFVLEHQVREAAADVVEQAARHEGAERNLIALGRERAALEGEMRDIPVRQAAQEELVKRNIAATARELAETEARRALSIVAPQAGTVTAIHATPGATVTPGMPLLSIVPRGAILQAHLYAPSGAVGFVRAGQRVLLRYRAYPYQKFGHYRGVIRSVSRSAIEPADLPAPFATGAQGAAAETRYRIVVALDRQQVTAYGKAVPLQPGMQLDAEILLDRRKLYEWVLEPLFTLTGTVQ
ncbi:HlyD family secretion protein [Pseudoduganella buxea]|uniref:HlyD family efflux transporter periplasmic adaptor subunit n=1 Tax=Pseudoduganella buxea TaxID=1949069 RepID=A0A6I3STH6_9BURK|nr:HlyD family efflux transporter periplasmic adaptor subunit [Pseudoduganella buxea]MTV52309.1 HlyD family efflux transporter periplasmic adaptor subunit [Pseudoduganella buxea]GGB86491.1 secretion protein [Pseudoduganella buxea]